MLLLFFSKFCTGLITIYQYLFRFKNKKMIKRKIIEHIHATSFHGFSAIARSESWIQRIVWFIIMAGAYGYCAQYITNNILSYLEYPVITNINTIHEISPQFPSVTFCNVLTSLGCIFNKERCRYIITRNSSCKTFNSGTIIQIIYIFNTNCKKGTML